MSDDEDDNTPLPPMLREDADATLYKYRDFALVLDVDNDCEPSTQNQANRSLESSIRVQKFPVKLYSILAQKEFSDIITWMPHGRSWKVLKPNLFESLVMPLFFEYSNYHSFNRLVNAWSFRRISSGSDRGSYYHEVKFYQFGATGHCLDSLFMHKITNEDISLFPHITSYFFEASHIFKSTCDDFQRLTRNSP